MSIISGKRTLTWENFKKIRPYHISLLCLGLLFFIPFYEYDRYGWYNDLYITCTSLILASLVVFFLVVSSNLKHIVIPRTIPFFIILALYWLLQPLWISLPYPALNIGMAGIFIFCAVFSCIIASMVKEFGIEKILTIMAYALLIGALAQDIVSILQYSNINLFGWMFVTNNGQVMGNLAQYNNLGDYLFWGLLSTCYLLIRRKLPLILGVILLVFQEIIFGLVPSRTVILYVIALFILLSIYYFTHGGNKDKRAIYIISSALLSVIICEFIVPKILPAHSGVARLLAGSGINQRLHEWLKVLLMLKDKPLLGFGWQSYAFESVQYDMSPLMDNRLRVGDLFFHSHNIILQIIAEMGLVGLAVVVIGFFYAIRPIFSRPANTYRVYIAGLIIVVLCHSMVEYPLWHVYFFIAFTVFITLASYPDENGQNIVEKNLFLRKIFSKVMVWRIILVIFSVSFMAKVMNVYSGYQELEKLRQVTINTTKKDILNQAKMMAEIGEKYPLLQNYFDQSAIDFLYRVVPEIPSWSEKVNQRIIHNMPFRVNLLVYTIVEYHNGKDKEALYYAKRLLRYYPAENVIGYSVALSRLNMLTKGQYQGLFNFYHQHCEDFAKSHPEFKVSCVYDKNNDDKKDMNLSATL